MLVIVEQLRLGLGRLYERMSLGQCDMRNNAILGQAGYLYRGLLPTTDGQRQVMLAEAVLAACIADKVHALQIGSSQRTDRGGTG